MARRPQSSPFDLCNFLFADGRQCCMPAVMDGYCKSHGSMERFRRTKVEENLEGDICKLFGPDSHLDVRAALERVFKAFSANQISARRAATFGYLGQLILVAKHDAEKDSTQRELHEVYNAFNSTLLAGYGLDGRRRQAAGSAPSSNSPEPSSAPRPASGASAQPGRVPDLKAAKPQAPVSNQDRDSR
jgi:hypothetical protein